MEGRLRALDLPPRGGWDARPFGLAGSQPAGRRRYLTMLFDGKDRKELEKLRKQDGRLPPGQSLTLKWPVLHYGSVPRFDPETWDFRVYGWVESPLRFSWQEFKAIGRSSAPAISIA